MRFCLYLFALVFVVSACVAPRSEALDDATAPLVDWYREEIALPPQFAPSLPAGEEVLLFAPGMFDADAEDYWSYVFLLKVNEDSMSRERIVEIFELYYDGLLASVAEGRNEDVGKDPAKVRMQDFGHGVYEMQIDLIDTFVTMKPLALNLTVEVLPAESDASLLRVMASPMPKEHKVWSQLDHALRSLSFVD